MEEHRCPVCNQICDEDAPYCTRCGWELSSPLKVGEINAEEERAHNERLAIARRNWNTIVQMQKEDECQQDAAATERKQHRGREQSREDHERKNQEQIQELINQIGETAKVDPYKARRFLSQLRELDPGESTISTWEQLISTDITAKEVSHALRNGPSNPFNRTPDPGLQRRRPICDKIGEIEVPHVRFPSWLQEGLMFWIVIGLLGYAGMPPVVDYVARLIGLGRVLSWVVFSFAISVLLILYLAIRGEYR